ncbi:hypothetical protein ACETK8_04115 [Brevundimonas staleyi]|uniref:Uncharacterized protein n=1 Tax=Brevundimonas staleyi TaxID=74326 RepID=A0ABW0FWJ6_9CAUL
MWRDLLSGRRRYRGGRSEIAIAADVWERAGQASMATLPVVAKVEKLAFKVYGEFGLPTQPGHYRRGPDDDAWSYLGEHVSAEARWAMILERPPEAGWRYATLEDLGRYPNAPTELKAAANLLATCRHLKNRLAGREPGNAGEDIQTAIRLGVDWRELQDLLSWRESATLKLTTPSDALPLPEPEAAPPEKPKTAKKPRAPRKKKAA